MSPGPKSPRSSRVQSLRVHQVQSLVHLRDQNHLYHRDQNLLVPLDLQMDHHCNPPGPPASKWITTKISGTSGPSKWITTKISGTSPASKWITTKISGTSGPPNGSPPKSPTSGGPPSGSPPAKPSPPTVAESGSPPKPLEEQENLQLQQLPPLPLLVTNQQLKLFQMLLWRPHLVRDLALTDQNHTVPKVHHGPIKPPPSLEVEVLHLVQLELLLTKLHCSKGSPSGPIGGPPPSPGGKVPPSGPVAGPLRLEVEVLHLVLLVHLPLWR